MKKKPTLTEDQVRDYKLAQIGLAMAIDKAAPFDAEIMEIERKIFDIMTSNVGMELSRLQVRLAEIKPKYESELQFAGRCALSISKSPCVPKIRKSKSKKK